MTLHLGKLAALGATTVLGIGSTAALPAAAQSPASATVADGTLTVRGSNAADAIALRLAAGAPAALDVDLDDDGKAEHTFDRSTFTRIVVLGGNGDDHLRVDQLNGSFTDEAVTLAGGNGDDTFAGGDGAELFLGDRGDDRVDGNRGADSAILGAGDDTFTWDPGDGSDRIDGDGGTDTMVFNGAGGPEQVDLSANGGRLTFFRNPGAITMDTAGVEQVDFNALGGADDVTVRDLTGTDVRNVNLDLAGALGGTTTDGETDRVAVTGTDAVDSIDIDSSQDSVTVSGLAVTTHVLHPDGADRLEIDTRAGDDSVDLGGLSAGAIQLSVDGVPAP
jgi:hypothetical protein